MKRILPIIVLVCGILGCQSEKTPEKTQELPVQAGVEADQTAPAPEIPRFPPAPELPPAPDTLRIAVISDINGSYGTIGYSSRVRAAVRHITENRYDFVVSPGDLIAGQKPGLDYAGMWKAFHYEVDDVFFDNNLEFIFAPGNHDASAFEGHAVERAAFAKAFENRHPKAPLIEGSRFPFHYGVVIRNVLVVALDITRPIRDDDPQLDWLDGVLHSNRNVRATLVLGHMPLSPVNLSQFWEVAGSPRLIKLLQNHPNTLYISGHHHIYYPGHIGELRTVASPALGNGPRSLMGAPAIPGYVQIVIPPQAPPVVTALVAPDFTRMINIKTLPSQVVRLEREDIGMSEYLIEMLDNSVKEQ